uniref:Uncharacterized protein n=1 Tax=viral metagenome TaxID=1070528 RepID=A0A6C0BP61_9ZZZZ
MLLKVDGSLVRFQFLELDLVWDTFGLALPLGQWQQHLPIIEILKHLEIRYTQFLLRDHRDLVSIYAIQNIQRAANAIRRDVVVQTLKEHCTDLEAHLTLAYLI